MKKTKKIILTLSLAALLFSLKAHAIDYPEETGLPEGTDVQGILESILSWLLGIVGTLALISFVISGLQYFLATGDDKAMGTAKKTMLYSIIGIIVALSGFIAIQAIDSLLGGGSSY